MVECKRLGRRRGDGDDDEVYDENDDDDNVNDNADCDDETPAEWDL